MQAKAVRTDIPTAPPIAVYQKAADKFLYQGLPTGVILVTFILIMGGHVGRNELPYLALIVGFTVLLAAYFAWDAPRSKVERYAEAVVISSPFQRHVFYFSDIEGITAKRVTANRFKRWYTEYTVQRRDGITMRFSDEFKGSSELVRILEQAIKDKPSG